MYGSSPRACPAEASGASVFGGQCSVQSAARCSQLAGRGQAQASACGRGGRQRRDTFVRSTSIFLAVGTSYQTSLPAPTAIGEPPNDRPEPAESAQAAEGRHTPDARPDAGAPPPPTNDLVAARNRADALSKMAESETSALSLSLHPLVIINVSDHFTRSRANAASPAQPARVFGVIFGAQNGRQVDVANSFEVKVLPGGSNAPNGKPGPDIANLKVRLEQYKKTFPSYEMLGWYSSATGTPGTTEVLQDGDLLIHQTLCDFCESSSLLYLTLDPVLALAGTMRELPITILESEVHVVNEVPTLQFGVVPYKIDSIESERIAIDHIAHILPTGDSSSGSAFTQHVSSQHTAMTMLAERIEVITKYLDAVGSGKIAGDHEILRQIKSLCSRLPALDTAKFADESMRDLNSTLLVAYLGAVTKGTGMVNDVVDKYNLAYDKHSRRRGIF